MHHIKRRFHTAVFSGCALMTIYTGAGWALPPGSASPSQDQEQAVTPDYDDPYGYSPTPFYRSYKRHRERYRAHRYRNFPPKGAYPAQGYDYPYVPSYGRPDFGHPAYGRGGYPRRDEVPPPPPGYESSTPALPATETGAAVQPAPVQPAAAPAIVEPALPIPVAPEAPVPAEPTAAAPAAVEPAAVTPATPEATAPAGPAAVTPAASEPAPVVAPAAPAPAAEPAAAAPEAETLYEKAKETPGEMPGTEAAAATETIPAAVEPVLLIPVAPEEPAPAEPAAAAPEAAPSAEPAAAAPEAETLYEKAKETPGEMPGTEAPAAVEPALLIPVAPEEPAPAKPAAAAPEAETLYEKAKETPGEMPGTEAAADTETAPAVVEPVLLIPVAPEGLAPAEPAPAAPETAAPAEPGAAIPAPVPPETTEPTAAEQPTGLPDKADSRLEEIPDTGAAAVLPQGKAPGGTETLLLVPADPHPPRDMDSGTEVAPGTSTASEAAQFPEAPAGPYTPPPAGDGSF